MTFAEKVKYVRGVLLISQKDLAKELGVSNVTINRWENGVINPSFLTEKTFLTEKKFEAFCNARGIEIKE